MGVDEVGKPKFIEAPFFLKLILIWKQTILKRYWKI